MKRFLMTGIIIFSGLLSAGTAAAATLNLKMALQTGMKNNQELKIAREKLSAAQSSVAVSRSAFFPALEAKGAYTYLGIISEIEMSSMSYTPMAMETDPYRHTHALASYSMPMSRHNNYEASLSLIQPLYTGGRIINSYKLAKIQHELERENYRKTRLKVIRDIKSAFYRYLLSIESSKLMEESYSQLKESVRSASLNYKSGIITRYDFMAISIQLANLEPALLQAQNAVHVSKEALKNILGLADDGFSAEGDFKYEKTELDLIKLQEEMLRENPDLKIMEMGKQSSEKAVSITRAGRMPSLTGMLNYKYTYIPSDSQTFGGNNPDSWNAVLALTIPVSEWLPWGKTINDTDRTKANLRQAELGLAQLKEALLLQLKQIVLDLATQYKLIESQKQNMENARETYLFRQKQYRGGLIRYTELIDAQVALTRAETNYLDAVLRTILAKSGLDTMLGRENTEEF